jgi:hypothetical protein
MNTYRLAYIFLPLVLILILTMVFSLFTISPARAELIHIISTRDHFDEFGNLKSNKPSYEPFPFNFGSIGCAQEAAIYVHGVWTAKHKDDEVTKKMFENGPEIFDRARLALNSAGYAFPVIGFSWDSDTEVSPSGWHYANIIAKKNGPKLAQFIFDLQENCPQTKIRLIAHSLGARVVLSSLNSLNNNQIWNNNNFRIASVHLMGAAVDNDEVSKNAADVVSLDGIKSAYGKSIEEEVTHFYNLFNSEDDVLEPGANYFYLPMCLYLYYSCVNLSEVQPVYYPYFEQDLALGQSGLQTSISVIDIPGSYIEMPVKLQIPNIDDADADGGCDLAFRSFWFPFDFICSIKQIGDNHLGYVGLRDPANYDSLKNNGVIDIVVYTLQNPP